VRELGSTTRNLAMHSSSKRASDDDNEDPAPPSRKMKTHRALPGGAYDDEKETTRSGSGNEVMPTMTEVVSGKLRSKTTKEGYEKEPEETKKEEDGPLAHAYHSMMQFFGVEKNTEPDPFSLRGMEKAPRVVTKRIVIIGTDPIAQQYLHRKLLRVPGDDFSAGEMSKVGVIAAHKASHSREIVMLEITEIPFQELMEELDSSNSHLLKEVLAISDVVVFVYNAVDIEETLRDDGDGPAEYSAYCPSFIDLQNLYDTLANMDLISKVPLRVVVGNIGLHDELKAGEVPYSSIKMAQEWAESHREEGMKFAKLGIGSESDVHHIGRLLESWMDI
jgi:hypothetical protein